MKKFLLSVLTVIVAALGLTMVTAQDKQATSCTLFDSPANAVIAQGKTVKFYAQPLLVYTSSGVYAGGDTLDTLQVAVVETKCYIYVHPAVSRYQGWVDRADLIAAASSYSVVSASSALGTPQPTLVAAEATPETGLDIIVVGEGSMLVAGSPVTVPYGSLVSLWSGNVRQSTLTLCLADIGCPVNGRGDFRGYEHPDGSKVSPVVLSGWIGTQAQYFPFADKIEDNSGNTVWSK